MIQRKTQTLDYWQKQFSVSDQDLELIYNQILEKNQLFSFDEIAVTLIKQRCDAEEVASRSELQQGKLYQPKESYEVGERVIFPLMEFAVGTVEYTRPARHPEYGDFVVIGIDFGKSNGTREFSTNFSHPHPLNANEQSLSNLQGLMSPEELYQTYHEIIQPKVKAVLDTHNDFVEFHEQYFLRDLLTDFHEGLFNIIDAAIDINNGPLSVDALIEQMDLADGKEITDIMRFSVSYRLANDERFDDVGPAGQSLWYLERLEPPEAHHSPRRLQADPEPYDASQFDDYLWALLVEIDDELTDPEDIPVIGSEINEITVALNYPHQRVGTLPLTPKTQSFFSFSYYNPVRFEFIDGRTGNTFPGWVVLDGKYVFGLDGWYQKNKLPVGAYITLKRTKDPLQIIINYQATRTQRDWIKMATVTNNRLTFQMNKGAIGCRYDELMILGELDQTEIDNLWLKTEERKQPIYDLLRHIFPELSKLNPQSTVHAKTLYSAVNIIRRASPGLVFQELTKHACFIPMDHGYWIYDPNLKD